VRIYLPNNPVKLNHQLQERMKLTMISLESPKERKEGQKAVPKMSTKKRTKKKKNGRKIPNQKKES
jgi:hypothetical protein